MKKTLCLKLFLFILLLNNNFLYADDIWQTDFSAEIDKGYWGTSSDLSGVLDWSLDISNCTLTDEEDYVMVVSTSGGRLEAKDCDGEAVWTSKSFDISGFTNVSLSVLMAETGSSTNTLKYAKAYYSLDGGAELAFELNAENIGNWGSETATQSNLNGDSLQIVIRVNNPNSGDLVYFDNIVVSGDPIVPESDQLTQIVVSENPIESVLLYSTNNDANSAVSCFSFAIDESSEAIDGLATKINRMIFLNSNPENGMSWENCLGGISLFSDSEEIIPQSISITHDSIVMDFAEEQVNIPDAEKKEFELKAFLNTNNTIVDGETFQLYCKKSEEGFECFSSGSGLKSENDSLLSALHQIEVEAERMIFSEFPTVAIRNQYFSVALNAVDGFNNKDFDADQELTLSLESGSGELLSPLGFQNTFVDGEIHFDSLQYSLPESIQLLATSDSLSSILSDSLLVENTYKTDIEVDSSHYSGSEISSLLTASTDAIEVFRFSVIDSGDDELPTLLQSMRFIGSYSNEANWEESIAEFILKRNGVVIEAGMELEDDQLNLLFADNEEVPSEDTLEYSVFCYLKAGNTSDKEIFQMKIDSLHNGWSISDAGSGLKAMFSNNLVGPEFTFEVLAQKMVFEAYPEVVAFQEEFEMLVQLEDSLGNIDTNFSTEIELSVASGDGDLTSDNLVLASENGYFLWSDLVYGEADNFTIHAECKDFSTILTTNISAVDQDSYIDPISAILASELSSLATSQEEAIPVLNFSIKDQASHDQLPTIISNLKFYNSQTDGSFSWSKHIAGAVLICNNEVIASSSAIEDDYISFSSSKGVLEIENDSEMDLSLAIFFRISQLPDKATFQVKIPQEHGWRTIQNSSSLAEFLDQDITSGILAVSVVESCISFSSYPFQIGNSDEKFALELVASDALNNIATNANGMIQLSLLQGNGDLTIPDSDYVLENGEVKIDSVAYSGDDDFRLLVESDWGRDSILIYVGEDELTINEDFETEGLNNWLNTSDWMYSSYQTINGNYSLKHNLSEEFGTSYISRSLPGFDPSGSAIHWSFIIRNGEWDPTSGNKFAFHVLMDDSTPEMATSDYLVGVNQTGSSDLLSFWNLDEEGNKNVLLESEFNWNENEAVAISLSYHPGGLWSISYNRLGSKENWTFLASIQSEPQGDDKEWFCALGFTFETASRAGNLWFDDLKVEAINTAPFLKSYEIVSADTLLLEYSESLDFLKSSLLKNFNLERTDGEVYSMQIASGEDNKDLVLVLDEELTTGDYLLELLNITDTKGAVQDQESITFGYFAEAKVNDVVINEIMADEDPSAGLPKYEYIELYNTSEFPISVEDWILKVSEKERVLSLDTIAAYGYLILCSNAAAVELSEYGSVLAMNSFPALSNSGDSIEIQSKEKLRIDQITYNDSWYQNDDKSNGGWSIERIDPENTAWQEMNWKASVDELGGTPGALNSIDSENSDNIAPVLLTCSFVAENCIQLVFNEAMASDGIFDLNNYQLTPELVKPVRINQIDEIGKEFQMYFQNDLIVNSQYKLLVSSEVKDLAENSLEITEYSFWVPGIIASGDLIVNEVLFNPYPNGVDFVEIVNISDKVLDISQLKIATRDESYKLTDEIFLSERFLSNMEYLLVTEDSLNIQENYFTSNPDAFIQVKSMPSFADDEGRVVLVSNDEIIDDFSYSEEMHFQLLTDKEGVSLERINPLGETNSDSNWQSAAQTVGFGTPGLQNSVFSDLDVVESEVSLSPKLFSPDNDGIDDRLQINFNLQKDGFLTNVRIYNSIGIEIRRLANNLNLAKEDSLFWDGLTSNQERASIGVYIVYIELFSPEGEVQNYKKTCVLGGKFN
ncbi:lamin tail domain-containing protein [Labilibaculum sp.]|uniref:lamin tail domain-containing protein n=1 Tax=Labilibaculum sp. TaxID=2060723 RepID=UPI003568AAB1